MKRFKKAICFILVFSICLSLFVIPAFAADFSGMVDSVVVGDWQYSEFVDGSTIVWLSGVNNDLTLASRITDLSGNQYRGFYFANQLNNSVYLQSVSFEQLEALSFQLTQFGVDNVLSTRRLTDRQSNKQDTYWCIRITQALMSTHYNGNFNFLGSPNFELLVAKASTDKTTSTNTNYNYYTQEGSDSTTNNEYNYITGDTNNNPIFKYGDEITENNQVYDYSSNQYVDVGDVTYDASTKQYTTNITIDNSVHVQYNIDHTSITYIGSSAEDKTYNLYYELPDGRNSSELTAEDLEQLVLNYNVINYGVSADDGRLRALYHFDGNLEDSSYWSKYSKWDWVSGASITYLESNAFGGCLYLDEGAHEFTITLPSNLASSDFTVLFRYYHSATTNSGTDLILKSGNVNLTAIAFGNDTVPSGTWNEFGFVKDGSQRYIYLNGICFYNDSFSHVFGNSITFTFNAGAVYRYLDELRVYNFATVEAGADYTPTAVPIDTNAVLVLPDQAIPVPDGYWDFNTDGNLLSIYDYTLGQDYTRRLSYYSISSSYDGYYELGGETLMKYPNTFAGYLPFNIQSGYYGLSPISKSYNLDAARPDFNYYSGVGWCLRQTTAIPASYYINLYTGVAANSSNLGANPYSLKSNTTYTFTVLFLDGETSSATFTTPNFSSTSNDVKNDVIVSSDWGYLILNQAFSYIANTKYIWAEIAPTRSVDLVYMELVEGSTSNDNSDAYVTEIYSDLDLTMPSIAIRSQIPIREYRIGGVRPSVPYRGDVWMMVEDSRITSVQIYTGFAWQEVDLRIWTGERWVSAIYYDIMTQQDYTDILGTTDNEYIQSTEGFYSWMTKQFKELLAILNEISDQIEDIDSGSGASLDFTFEIDGSTTVEFTKLSDDARNGLLRVAVPLYDILFSEAGTIYEGVLSDFALLFDLDSSSVTVEDEETYSIWFIFNADEEVWNVRSIC